MRDSFSSIPTFKKVSLSVNEFDKKEKKKKCRVGGETSRIFVNNRRSPTRSNNPRDVPIDIKNPRLQRHIILQRTSAPAKISSSDALYILEATFYTIVKAIGISSRRCVAERRERTSIRFLVIRNLCTSSRSCYSNVTPPLRSRPAYPGP